MVASQEEIREMNTLYSGILQKIMMAEQTGNYIVCDSRELLKIEGTYYLPQKNEWIQKPYYCSDDFDYKKIAIRMTTILDRHSGLTAEQI